MIFSILFLVAGLVLLIKGADWLVDGASSLAGRFGISALVIGLTVVAFGTSAPEFIINIFASVNGATDIAIGNVVGSNIANILLILGISSLIFPLTVTRGTVWKEIPLALLAVLIIAFMANDALLEGKGFSEIGLVDGLVLLAFFSIFLAYVIAISKNGSAKSEGPVKQYGMPVSMVLCVGGLICLGVGGKFVVDGAMAIAQSLGLSQAFIGLTVVAVGTSLPELATSVTAARKKNSDIAVGNIVGSNIFNIFWILGASAVIKPLVFSPALNADIAIGIVSSFLLFLFMFVGARHTLERWQGAFFVVAYAAYILYLLMRG